MVSYPLLVHASVLLAMPYLQVLALILFLLGAFGNSLLRRPWQQGQWIPWLIFLSLVSGILLLGYFSLTLYLLYLPPIAIPLALLIFFGRTLLPGNTPLITMISTSLHGTLSDALKKYTRLLTQLWCVVFFTLVVVGIILPCLKQPALWSWVTNFINYGVVGILFVGEYLLRKKMFPERKHLPFFEYLRMIVKANMRKRG